MSFVLWADPVLALSFLWQRREHPLLFCLGCSELLKLGEVATWVGNEELWLLSCKVNYSILEQERLHLS